MRQQPERALEHLRRDQAGGQALVNLQAGQHRLTNGPGLDGRGRSSLLVTRAGGQRPQPTLDPAAVALKRVRGAQQRGVELQVNRQLFGVSRGFRGGGAAELSQPLGQRPRLVVKRGRVIGGRVCFERAQHEVLLAGEVPVDGALGYLRRLRDLLKRGRRVAALAEQPLRLRQQALPRALLGFRSGHSGHVFMLPH